MTMSRRILIPQRQSVDAVLARWRGVVAGYGGSDEKCWP